MKAAEKALDDFVYRILDEREATVGSDFNADSKGWCNFESWLDDTELIIFDRLGW